MKTEITFTLNGAETRIELDGHELLLDVLRGSLRHTGSKESCGKGECGACTVLLDDRPVNSCLLPALEVEGRNVVTIEGLLGPEGELSPVQRAFEEEGGTQCGFCAPGMVLSAKALIDQTLDPTDEEIRDFMAGNLCRCTGYFQIVESVRRAAELTRQGGEA